MFKKNFLWVAKNFYITTFIKIIKPILISTSICIYYVMSAKSVYSIRIPIRFRNMMDEMDDVNWQEEIRELTLQLIKEKSKKKL